MPTTAEIAAIIQEKVADTEHFMVDIAGSDSSKIHVDMDGDNGFGIDDCVALHRYVKGQFEEDARDFPLEISTPGLDKPLRITRQFVKNIGRTVDVLTSENDRIKGKLTAASDEGIELLVKERVKVGKQKKSVEKTVALSHDQISETKVVIQF